ncbi:MAG: hypothetical protein ACXV3S_04610 [Kineosporiaceae bacterium]
MRTVRGDIYGWKHADLAAVAEQVAAALSVTFELRHSYFHGGDYYNWNSPGGGELIVQQNSRDADGDLEYAEFPEHRVLLHAGALDDAAYDVLAALPGVDLLESHVLPIRDA